MKRLHRMALSCSIRFRLVPQVRPEQQERQELPGLQVQQVRKALPVPQVPQVRQVPPELRVRPELPVQRGRPGS
ncbi:hypothetical protein F210042A8_11810 [Blautia parvula]